MNTGRVTCSKQIRTNFCLKQISHLSHKSNYCCKKGWRMITFHLMHICTMHLLFLPWQKQQPCSAKAQTPGICSQPSLSLAIKNGIYAGLYCHWLTLVCNYAHNECTQAGMAVVVISLKCIKNCFSLIHCLCLCCSAGLSSLQTQQGFAGMLRFAGQ